MIEKTEAIVLNHLKYGETSLIVHLYTSRWGRLSMMVRGALGHSKNRKANLFQPLSILEIDLYHKEGRDLHNPKEIRNRYPFQSLPFDPEKTAIGLFLTEILSKTLHEEEANPSLFEFVSSSIQYLDVAESGVANFHLHFLVHLTRYLGFHPESTQFEDRCWFDLRSGTFLPYRPEHGECLEPQLADLLHRLLEVSLEQLSTIQMNRQTRYLLLEGLIHYYQSHLDGMREIRSHEVLRTLFD